MGESLMWARTLLQEMLEKEPSLDEQIKTTEMALFHMRRDQRYRTLKVSLKKGNSKDSWRVMRGDKQIGLLQRTSGFGECSTWQALGHGYRLWQFSGPGARGEAQDAVVRFDEIKIEAAFRRQPIDRSHYVEQVVI